MTSHYWRVCSECDEKSALTGLAKSDQKGEQKLV